MYKRLNNVCVCIKRVDITDTGGHVYEAKRLSVCICVSAYVFRESGQCVCV